jgi:hypothetical protein
MPEPLPCAKEKIVVNTNTIAIKTDLIRAVDFMVVALILEGAKLKAAHEYRTAS